MLQRGRDDSLTGDVSGLVEEGVEFLASGDEHSFGAGGSFGETCGCVGVFGGLVGAVLKGREWLSGALVGEWLGFFCSLGCIQFHALN